MQMCQQCKGCKYTKPTSKYPEPELVMFKPRKAEAHFDMSVDPVGQLAALMFVPYGHTLECS
jgi:hypothetical protein